MEIIATKREKFGKQTKSLRKEGLIPAVLFGAGMDSTPLTIKILDFTKVYREAGETTLVDIKFNGSNEKVLIAEVQVNPVNLKPMHVNFHKVDLTATIKANIPVEIIGEDKSPVVLSGEGMILTLLNEIEVEALPSNLPSSFEVDVSHLMELDQSVTIGELKYDKSLVTIVSAEDEDLIVKVDYAEMAEEEEVEVTEEELIEGMEVTGEKEGEEGEEGEGEETKEDKKEDKKEAPVEKE